ncbi:hypothetical protein CCY99_09065 [Helicobacter sp. 16-1353]|uniref:Gfo/Idh/MocA family protein n=1 Tax=Helicobacter sp. 16-1353 TaxID=2004996 RepID=UPI000DCDEF5D|nr:Gfo/Idh/MocA family oxidoreductase [Helicobacter sp. 16-1353]RAX51421.1 hypothetical protein CCY99_09065 [Helicobacter sp. 16-1353]
MKVFNLAFIGGAVDSAIGYTHFIASQMDHRFSLKAACFSRNKEINRQSASLWCNYDDFNLYDNYLDLLENERENIDAICVLTPTPTHKNIVCDALKYGYAVICEKTLCMSLKEALEIKDILDSKNGFLAITYNYTGYPMLRELREMIINGDFGRVHNIQIEMPQEGFIRNINGMPPKPQEWRLSDVEIPIISLDLGVHTQNIISFLSGKKPENVLALANSAGHFKHIIDDVSILASFSDDLIVNMWYSKSALGFRNGLKVRVFGENLSSEWIQNNPEELLINTKEGERIIKDRASPLRANIANLARYNRFKAGHPAGFIEAFGNYYNDIATSLNNFKNNKPFSPYTFGIKSAIQELIFFEAVSKSYKNKSQIIIKDINESRI